MLNTNLEIEKRNFCRHFNLDSSHVELSLFLHDESEKLAYQVSRTDYSHTDNLNTAKLLKYFPTHSDTGVVVAAIHYEGYFVYYNASPKFDTCEKTGVKVSYKIDGKKSEEDTRQAIWGLYYKPLTIIIDFENHESNKKLESLIKDPSFKNIGRAILNKFIILNINSENYPIEAIKKRGILKSG